MSVTQKKQLIFSSWEGVSVHYFINHNVRNQSRRAKVSQRITFTTNIKLVVLERRNTSIANMLRLEKIMYIFLDFRL